MILFFSSAILNSCAYFDYEEQSFKKDSTNSTYNTTSSSNMNEELDKFQKNFFKLRFDGSGKGRIIVEDKTHRFSFDSKLDLNQHLWTLLLFFPLHKEEKIIFNWNNFTQPQSNNIQPYLLQGNLDSTFTELTSTKNSNYSWLELIWTTMGKFFAFYKIKEFDKCIFDPKQSETIGVSSGSCEKTKNRDFTFKWKSSAYILELEFDLNHKKNKKFVIIKGHNISTAMATSDIIKSTNPHFDYLTIKLVERNDQPYSEFEHAKINLIFDH